MKMEALLAQLSYLSDQASSQEKKNFDPGMVEELMELFQTEVYPSWSSLDDEARKAVEAEACRISLEELPHEDHNLRYSLSEPGKEAKQEYSKGK
ncbi:hypothetical protein H6P81_011041 [Aristolochia fimbriata]|uniref:Uncharacterized protein n=1 Tax=Aristolochia fimbriata TaxID=158543 RepID=A0AAV7ET98_ARIFI|nr:hypothetical protein H6P81_011041 [Aristolochia fimbriata]